MRSRSASQQLRNMVFERDGGICAACKADCEKIKRVFWAILDHSAQVWYAEVLGIRDHWRTFWDADHIKEVAEDGSDSLLNLQTLCVACHREKTRVWQQTRIRPTVAIVPVIASVALEAVPVVPELTYEEDEEIEDLQYYYWPIKQMPAAVRINVILAFVNRFIMRRAVANGGYWPRRMEPIDADKYWEDREHPGPSTDHDYFIYPR